MCKKKENDGVKIINEHIYFGECLQFHRDQIHEFLGFGKLIFSTALIPFQGQSSMHLFPAVDNIRLSF